MVEANEMDLIGTLKVDCTAVAEFAVDLPPGGLVGLQTRHEGFEEAMAETLANQSTLGDRAGVTAYDIQQLELTTARIAKVQRHLPAARKLVEVLEETEAKLVDQQQRQLAAIAASVDMRAKASGDTELLARYEKTRAYRSARAVKAAKTRRRNAAAAAGAAVDEPSTQA